MDSKGGSPYQQPSPSTYNASGPVDATPNTRQGGSTAAESAPIVARPLSRSGTLSWQQRPNSRGSVGPRSRPLSAVAQENHALLSPRATPESQLQETYELSRSQIAQSLSAKDPSWFRQTADRGLGSKAYRKNQEESWSATEGKEGANGRVKLPGLSRAVMAGPESDLSLPLGRGRSPSSSRETSVDGDSRQPQRHPSITSMFSAGVIGSPLPTLSSQRFAPPTNNSQSSQNVDPNSSKNVAVSPVQGRMSPGRPDRPTSPTKGLGGFVQSAMMKRSDSVNKRWSAQAGPGLSRGNSIASNRSGYDGSRPVMGSMSPPRDIKAESISRENSPISISRPGSSGIGQPDARALQSSQKLDMTGVSHIQGTHLPAEDQFVKPALPERLSRPQTPAPEGDVTTTDVDLPVSPSKTMDPKRWSPTKASWLETALNKPESPKVKATALSQPSWMSDLNKAKQQRGGVELPKSASFKGVTTAGLMRSPPMGSPTKSASIHDVAAQLSSGRSGSDSRPSSPAKIALVPGRETSSLVSDYDQQETPSTARSPLQDEKATFPQGFPKNLSPSAKTSTSQVSSPKDDNNSSKTLKSKPQTPPKKDFRSNLKARQVADDAASSDVPEFRNVFGKLKKTQTQNYVAPDMLKDNILRGKSGLAVTGGPKKTDRKDEFKESILKKKEAMQAATAAGTQRKTSGGSISKDELVPEAILKRRGLGRSESNLSSGTKETERTPISESPAKQESIQGKPARTTPEKSVKPGTKQPSESALHGKLADRFHPTLAGILSRGPPSLGSNRTPSMTETPSVGPLENGSAPAGESIPAPGAHLTHMTKARARGPKRRLPANNQIEVLGTPNAISTPSVEASAVQKNAATPVRPEVVEDLVSRPLANITNGRSNQAYSPTSGKPDIPSKTTGLISPKFEAADNTSLTERNLAFPTNAVPQTKQKPSIGFNEPKSKPPVFSQASPSQSCLPALSPNKPQATLQFPKNMPNDATKPAKSTGSKNSLPSIKAKSSQMKFSMPSASSIVPPAKSPIKLPTWRDEEALRKEAGLDDRKSNDQQGTALQDSLLTKRANSPPPTWEVEETIKQDASIDRQMSHASFGLGLRSTPSESRTLHNKPEILSSSATSPKSPPLPPKKSDALLNRVVSNGAMATSFAKVNDSPVPRTSQAVKTFSDFFDDSPISHLNVDIDAQAVLSSNQSRNESAKIKTLRKQIWEVSGDGKHNPVPPQQEHILFEANMYLCTHVFGSLSGTRTTEVYLWAGDGVSSSAIEDAQLFSRKVAKDSGGRLIVVKQGKELANFFQALGGIVITRRGSSGHHGSSSALATYMLCGRRHMGQIAFDEVPFSPDSLCSGFPYIISARFGKLFLWKGKGSGAEELGCARLIGMDLGLTGEIEEIDEGAEPETFWEAFSNQKRKSAEDSSHWHLKPNCEKYATRLFTVEHETRPKSSSGFNMWGRRPSTPAVDAGTVKVDIREISPYSQDDLAKDGLYVVDAFLEIFM